MTQEKFIKDVELLAKYGGDINGYMQQHLNDVERTFSLNDTFSGVLTENGARDYNDYYKDCSLDSKKCGDRLDMQFHEAIRIFNIGCGAQILPMLECKLK